MRAEIELKFLKRKDPRDLSTLQSLLESVPSYWSSVSMHAVASNAAEEMFQALPPGKSLGDQHVLAVECSGHAIGCADLIRAYPDAETAMLGLLLISETHQKKGFGKLAYESIEDYARSWEGIRKIRIGVVRTNEGVLPFWKALGFRETGERRPYGLRGVVSETIVLENPVRST